VALLSEMFSPNMGYLENIFPKYLARLGVEVHVVAMDLPTQYRSKGGEGLPAGTVQETEGYTLHILGHRKVAGYMRMKGLEEKLSAIRPDIVQTIEAIGWVPLDAAYIKLLRGYKLFTGSHFHASIFPLANKDLSWWNHERLVCTLTRATPGRLVGLVTEKCYTIAEDCADIAVRFFGVPEKKTVICPLGVDTELFRPASGEGERLERDGLREKLGFLESDIVCIYTGRLNDDKNPLLLAQAIAELQRRGERFRGLFLGDGTQLDAIRAQAGCVTHPFVPVQELAGFYRATEIGVWPAQESMSMLDAAACGLPIVVNDTISVAERTEGNGLLYKLNDLQDLVRVLLELRDPGVRRRLGSAGASKMARDFSWDSVARRRLNDYQAALRGNHANEPSC